MGAIAPAVLKNRLLTPAMFGLFSAEGKKCDAELKSYLHSAPTILKS